MTQNFNSNKAKELYSINDQGASLNKNLKNSMELLNESTNKALASEKSIAELNTKKEELMYKIQRFECKDTLIDDAEYLLLQKQIAKLEDKLSQPAQSISDVMDLKEKKKELDMELQETNKKLNLKDQNERFRTRIKELMLEEKTLSQQIADIEKQEFLCEEFIKTKVELLENNINNKFMYVNFKLFDTQNNGGINECCEALINGVPFSSANKASQYNAEIRLNNYLNRVWHRITP